MKKLLVLTLVTLCSTFTYANNHSDNTPIQKEQSNTVSSEYTIRLGLLDLNGNQRLSGWEDLGGFYATNLETGEVFYSERSNTVLPGFILDLPEGTYEFSAMQGQGGWVGYGSITATLSDNLVDGEGYITIYIPVAWAE